VSCLACQRPKIVERDAGRRSRGLEREGISQAATNHDPRRSTFAPFVRSPSSHPVRFPSGQSSYTVSRLPFLELVREQDEGKGVERRPLLRCCSPLSGRLGGYKASVHADVWSLGIPSPFNRQILLFSPSAARSLANPNARSSHRILLVPLQAPLTLAPEARR
jgi:hypothetical protein